MSYAALGEGAAASRGRPSKRGKKFTSERIEQIKDLFARGEPCEMIAAKIGVTVGSLKVTCSKLGISLRRPKVKRLPPRTATDTAKADGGVTFALCLRHNGQERNFVLPLMPGMVGQLALEACFRNQKIDELAKDIVQAVMEKGLLDEVLGERQRPRNLGTNAPDAKAAEAEVVNLA